MVVRSHSRGRFDRSPLLDAADYDRPIKKSSFTPRGESIYATPPRSPLDARSASRPRFSREREYDDRNPLSEGRTFSHSSFGRSASTMRERFDDDESLGRHSAGGSSAAHAREVLSKMRGGRGLYSEPSSKVPMSRLGRNMSHLSVSSPRRRLDVDDDPYESRDDLGRYEVLGMKEELKKRNTETAQLRREMDEMTEKYQANMSGVRATLVSTFKEDMQEMKAEWEEAFRRLKDESDTTQRAMEMELTEATRAKSDMEGELNELKAEFRAQIEQEKERGQERLEDLKRSKEEDLERLRAMYEEHLDSTKKTSADVEGELKEEIHVLLEENEKVKLCYENLEAELNRYKADLDELNANYQKAIGDNVRWEKEAASYKEELDEVLDENQKRARQGKAIEGELASTKEELERTTSDYQRSQAEKARLEKELAVASKERDEAASGYDDLVKKLDGIQEERTLEGRYTEALVKQRDNMNAILESGQAELEELKAANDALGKENKLFSALGREFRLKNGDPSTLREELVKAEQYAAIAEEFRFDGPSAMREELSNVSKMKERLETLGRERERYNATVKALKVDLRALHGGDIGPETSLQEHMRLLNEKWDGNQTRLKQVDKLKSELEESIQLLEENAKAQERLTREHHDKVGGLQRELQETQTALVKMEREKLAMDDKLSDYELSEAKKKRHHEEMELKCEKMQKRLENAENELRERETEWNNAKATKRSLQAELDDALTSRAELEEALGRTEDVKKGLKKKLESAYYELEETSRELSSIRREHEKELQRAVHEEVKTLTDALKRAQDDRQSDINEAKAAAEESFKVQMRLLEEKHAEQERRNMDVLRKRNAELEEAMKHQKENLDQKSMAEIKRRGEFAKQKQELEILRSKERHLETHVNQLEEHISKVVADYEAKLQHSAATVCGTPEADELRKQVKDLEKKLEVSSAAMKQIGKSSLLMEKENERLKHDKNELKLKLKKLVDCAERFGPK